MYAKRTRPGGDEIKSRTFDAFVYLFIFLSGTGDDTRINCIRVRAIRSQVVVPAVPQNRCSANEKYGNSIIRPIRSDSRTTDILDEF